MKRLVTLTIEASGRHCGAVCPFRRLNSCLLFPGELGRSKRSRFIRLQACRKADAGPLEKEDT